MTTSQTLFGGLALVGAIYYLLRAFRVSNYWSAVSAAGIPVAAYIIYTSAQWRGGDQLAMHLAAYIAAATGLALIGTRTLGATRRLHWAPRALVIFFVVLFLINAALMSIASNGLPPAIARLVLPGERAGSTHTAFPGVVPHDQSAANTITSELKQRERLAALGWRLSVDGLEKWQSGREQRVTLSIDAQSLPSDLHAKLQLRRVGEHAAVVSSVFMPNALGQFNVLVVAPEAGSWTASIEITAANEHFRFDRPMTILPVS